MDVYGRYGRCVVMVALVALTTSCKGPAPPPAPPRAAGSAETPTAPAAPVEVVPKERGLYVDGFALQVGASVDKVRAHFGTDDSRYGDKKAITYVWKQPGGVELSIEFDEIGSMVSATAALGDTPGSSPSVFTFLDGHKVTLGETTLGQVKKWYPYGLTPGAGSGEDMSVVPYTVGCGPEGSEAMVFCVRWRGMPRDKTSAEQDAMPLTSLEIRRAD